MLRYVGLPVRQKSGNAEPVLTRVRPRCLLTVFETNSEINLYVPQPFLQLMQNMATPELLSMITT